MPTNILSHSRNLRTKVKNNSTILILEILWWVPKCARGKVRVVYTIKTVSLDEEIKSVAAAVR